MTANLKQCQAQVAQALSDWANEVKVNGLSTWDASDFRVSAEKFVNHVDAAAVNSYYLELRTVDDYKRDLMELLIWEIEDKHKSEAIDVCLFEVGNDLTGLDFEDE